LKGRRRRLLSSKEVRDFSADVSSALGNEYDDLFDRISKIELIETDEGDIYYFDGRPVLVKIGEKRIPTLLFGELLKRLPWVFIDRGAIPHVCNGADVMAPGIKEIKGAFKEGMLVVVGDSEHKKALAVGLAMLGDGEARQTKKGKVVKNLHHVGDPIWGRIRETQ
jgi:PUA domain protein